MSSRPPKILCARLCKEARQAGMTDRDTGRRRGGKHVRKAWIVRRTAPRGKRHESMKRGKKRPAGSTQAAPRA
eukprot:365672-Chlamydomonas_euryale.AAC.12